MDGILSHRPKRRRHLQLSRPVIPFPSIVLLAIDNIQPLVVHDGRCWVSLEGRVFSDYCQRILSQQTLAQQGRNTPGVWVS
jgi:hypothetical protein